MFQNLNVDNGVERAVAKGQFRDIAEHFDFRIIPGFVADATIQADVVRMGEQGCVGTLACAGVQNHGSGGKFTGGRGEMFEQDGVKRVHPSHDEAGHQGLDQPAEA